MHLVIKRYSQSQGFCCHVHPGTAPVENLERPSPRGCSNSRYKKKKKQECIPVGCVPTAAVATTRCHCGGVCLQVGDLHHGGGGSVQPHPTPGQND